MQCLPHKQALFSPRHHHSPLITTNFLSPTSNLTKCNRRSCSFLTRYRSITFRKDKEEDEDWRPNSASDCSSRFEEAVKLFNEREYYARHDVLESIWHDSNDPLRTLCMLAFSSRKGATMELGEAVCKLRKLNFKTGPFHQFEQGISAVLHFICQTQLELAACESHSHILNLNI
ncbi:hypothetical protein Cgig2_003509 [Carnegiea gigantea]|uniref:DUF309 domain-containing protein n=1 Tax=Carnegiea gigantea TaxID=171969 RepID=A0A9Q1GNP2_9CARY|nr:hypothetical protein Cgig2_003509 [Carnegiea gigantea]